MKKRLYTVYPREFFRELHRKTWRGVSFCLLLVFAASFSINIAHASSAPTVTTGSATSITTTSATLVGNVTNANDRSVTQRGFQYGTDTNYGQSVSESVDVSYSYASQWGRNPSANGQFKSPSSITTDSSGNVYVADTNNNRIQKFDSSGNYLTQWGSNGSGNGQFSSPQGIATDSSGNVYVADSQNYRVQKFDSSGTYLTKWGSFGSGNGQFSSPNSIATNSSGNVYVLDTGNSRVQKFDSSGTYLAQWGSNGSSNSQFSSPQGIATDSSGNVYVADTSNHRIQKFDASGTYLTQWGSQGSGNGQFNYPRGVATDSSGNVYVADTSTYRIEKFDSNGTYLTKWGSYGTGNGQLNSPNSIATDSSGNVYVADTNNSRIQKFDSSGSYLTQWGRNALTDGQFNQPRGITIDSSGNVYVADTDNNRIQKFDSSGTYLTKWGSFGSANGQFKSPHGITTDSSGNVYVVDVFNHRIQKFDSSGTYLTKWGSFGSGNGQFDQPLGIATDSSGNVYVADTQNNRIQKFDSSGTYLTMWGSSGTGNSQFDSPGAITTDSSGNVYVMDANNNRIQKFDSNGTYLTLWGSNGSGGGGFAYPQGIATDSSGNVYVADTQNNRIQKFDSSGTYLTQWGSNGSGNSQFLSVSGVAIGLGGEVITVDYSNERVQKFAPSMNTGTYSQSISSLVCGSSYHYRATATNSDGTSYGSDALFTTAACPTPPIVSTGSTSGIGLTTVSVVSYSISSDGDSALVQSGVEYGADTNYGSSKNGAPNTVGGNNASLFGLSCGTTYHYRAFATNAIGTTVGDDSTFTSGTCPLPPTVTTGSATSLTTTSAMLGGSVASTNGGGPVTQRGFNYGLTNSYGSTSTENTNVQLVYQSQWGSNGSGNGQFNNPFSVARDALGNVYVSDFSNARIQKFDSNGTYLTQWGSQGSGNGQFNTAYVLTTDNVGNVYVSDTYNYRIQKFDSNGTYLTQWGSQGSGNGQFIVAIGIATDSSGNVYVADSQNHRIQKFDSSGNYLTKWGSYGQGDGQFNFPQGITTDPSGNVYVADTNNSRIQKFNSIGTYLTQWGSDGGGNGQFNTPIGITTDSSGNVYVADTYNQRIQKFDGNGTYLTKWGSFGSGNGQFNSPRGITTDPSGNVYVADTINQRIQRFGIASLYEGDFSRSIGSLICETTYHYQAFATNSIGTSLGDDQTFTTSACPLPPTVTTGSATDLTFASATLNGSVANTNGGGSVTQRGINYGLTNSYGNTNTENTNIQPVYQTQWGTQGSGNGQFYGPQGITTDSSGNVYVVDTNNHRIQKFDSNGTYLTQWGSNGSGNGQFNYPQGITTDSSGNVYVVDTNNHRIQKFDSNGTYLAQWGTYGSGNGQFSYPFSITTDSSGNVYVADANNYRIQKFDSNGTYLTQWGTQGSGNGQFSYVKGITTDSSSNVYVVDTLNHRIQKFDSNGTYLTQWGSNGSGNGQFNYPHVISADLSGNVYVADTSNNRIQKFDSNGTYLTQWGTYGSGNGQFKGPFGISADSSGNIYVLDTDNQRIQKFSSPSLYEGDFSRSVEGLTCETTYHYQAFATNSVGTSLGDDQTFTTGTCPTLATVLTRSATNVTSSTADTIAQVVSEGNNSLTGVGVEYGLDTNYGDSVINYSGIVGNNDLQMTNLSCETAYHYRAFATNFAGTVVGDDMTFTTDRCKADVPTNLAYQIGSTTSIIVTWDAPSFTGQGSIDGYIIYYRVLGSTDWSSVEVHQGTSYTLDGLAPGTQYEIRVTAFNDGNYESDPSTTIVGVTATPNFQPVSDCQQLQAMQNVLDANYELTRNIDCSVTNPANANFDSNTWDGSGFNPVGVDNSSPFTGVFKGNNYTISGLYMDKDDVMSGLFGATNQAIVQDVVLDHPQITATFSYSTESAVAAALIGSAQSTSVTNVRVLNPVVVGTNTAGIGVAMGGAYNSPMHSVRVANGLVTTDSTTTNESYTGGLAGSQFVTDGQVSDSTNNFVGAINSQSSFVGGLYGIVFTQGSYSLSNSYTQAIITNTNSGLRVAGGLMGYGYASNNNGTLGHITVSNSYAAGSLNLPVLPPVIGFRDPRGITTDSSGNVYVADTNNNQIQKFTNNGSYLTKWGSSNSGNGQFNSPRDVSTDSLGNVYVADTYNHRIQKFDSNGTYLTQWGTQGSGNGQFNYPQGITTDSSGNVYVEDHNNSRIQKFDSNGTYLTQWGTQGSGDGQFNSPGGITTDTSGNVYVADTGNNRIQKFDSNGTYITKWGSNGNGNGQFNSLQGITTDSSGNVYVVDYNNQRIQKFDSNGTYLTQWGTQGSGDSQFSYPQGITTDTSGNVYVADTGNNRIQKFDSNGTYITKWGSYNNGDNNLNLVGGLFGITVGQAGQITVTNTFAAAAQSHGSTPDVYSGGIVGSNTSDSDNQAYFTNNYFDADLAGTTDCATTQTLSLGGGVSSFPLQCIPISGDPNYFRNSNNPPMDQWDFANIWMKTPQYPVFGANVTANVALTAVPPERLIPKKPSSGGKDSSPAIVVPPLPSLAKLSKPSFGGTAQNPENKSLIGKLSDKVKQFLRNVPAPVLRAFPYVLFGTVALSIGFMFIEMGRQARRLKVLQALIAKQRAIAQQRDTFWHLAANYLRAPITLLMGGVELLTMSSPVAKSLGAAVATNAHIGQSPTITKVAALVSTMQSKVSDIMQRIEGSQTLKDIDWPKAKPIRSVFFRIAFWLPLLAVAGLTLLANYVIHDFRKLNVSSLTYLTQVMLFILVAVGLYWILTSLGVVKNKRKDAEIMLAKQTKALHSARTDLVSSAASSLDSDVADLQQALKDLPKDSTAIVTMQEGAERLRSMIDSFKLLSNAENGTLEKLSPIGSTSKLDTVLGTTLEDEQAVIDAKHLTIDAPKPALLNLSVPGAIELNRQVIGSVLNNAFAFSPSNATIQLELLSKPHYQGIAIHDQGGGVSEEQLAHMFEPFTKADGDDALRMNHEGLGIDLYLNKLIMQYLGGDITAESEEGKGTTVSMWWPKNNYQTSIV